INDVSDSLIVSAGPTAKFLLNNPGDMSVGNRIAYTISRTDAYDTPTTEGDSTVYLYNNSTGTSTLFYDLASGGNTITSTIIPAGNDSVGFWFGSDEAGSFEVKASDNSSSADGAIGIVDGQDSITVNPLPIVATRFIIIDPIDAVAGETVPIIVKAVDGAGNIDATYQNDVTLKTNGNATPGGVVDIVNGIGEINITDTKAETVSLTLEDSMTSGLDVSSSQSVTFSAGPAAKFTVSDLSSAVAGTRSNYTVTRFDQYDNQVTSGLTTFYLYSNATAGTYAFYDAGSEGGQISSASILNNSATANVWFEGDKVGAWMISASDNATAPDGPDGLVDGTDNIEITAAATSRLELNDPGDMQAGTKLGYTATRYDRFGNLVTSGGATYYPYSNAGGTATAFYSSAMGTTPITSVNFSAGQSTADFWYGESKLGLWTVSLSDNSSSADGATGIVDGEDAVTVSSVPIVATRFIIIDPANVYVGTPVEVTVRAINDDGDIDTTYQSDVTLKASGSATGEGLVNIVNGVGQITINDTKEETVTLSLEDTQHTNLDTSSTETVTFSITAPLPSGSGGGGGGGAVTPRVSFIGRSFPGAKLTILAIQDGQVPITKQSTGSSNGTFQINFSDDLPVGAQTFAVKAVDKNNLIAQTKIYKLGANEQLSQKILISPTVDLRNSIVTRGTNLGVIGSAMPRYKVEAFVDNKSIGSATAGSNGQYTILPNTYQLELGDHAVKVKQIDATGQASDFSIEKKFRIVNTFIPKADLNDDGVVNVQDWSIFMAKWKSTDTKGREILDMNGDGKVDTQDFGTFMKAFGK
ncbi:MAG: dockerin type I domain-containing protein, partial [Candidatus Vogelbacteria bacterium]|nr:dockerin type I domain-containing protein [Candidatus Vogelbacteria bacterium]